MKIYWTFVLLSFLLGWTIFDVTKGDPTEIIPFIVIIILMVMEYRRVFRNMKEVRR